ncbi:hypothetical protein GDO81_006933 [Engystomops pustulosus]|uniref:Neural cell adhesion molecule 2 n=2 Tax=Engystomops pustulosus TaxID=76066 RepID=A0AAV7D098_ENGPU|nr:hypothetical protein GDO81_006933 [Engystomops pustulosus]
MNDTFLLSCYHTAVLQVSISLSKVEISVGQSKYFTCTVLGEAETIDWYNPQGEKIISNQRVVAHREGMRSWLTIYNANIDDAGIYRCQATDSKGHTQESTVVVEIYQKLSFEDVRATQEFRRGEDAEVVCHVTSSPAPMVRWLTNGEDITDIDDIPPAILIQQRSFNATADRQEDISIFCRASGSPKPYISWHRNGKMLEENDKYSLREDNTELTIRNIINSDAGSYTCRATNKAGFTEKQSFLQVFVQPHIIQLQNETTVENGHVTLTCEAEGEPIPEITWKRASDGRTFTDGDRSQDDRIESIGHHGKSALRIRNVMLSDSGRYDCEAASRIGGHQKSMYLNVEYAPKFISNQTIYYSWENNPINISCDVISNPPSSIFWSREKILLPARNITNIKTYRDGKKILLEITPISDNDFGRYNCTAINSIGSRIQEYVLTLADVPSSPHGLRVIELSQTYAKIFFNKPDSHGGVPIHHYQMDFKEVSSDTWKVVHSHGTQTIVVLANLEANTTYEVKVAAVNGKGQGEYSKIEIFQTLPVREPSPPSIHGQPGAGKSFKLSITKQDDGGAPILNYVVKYKSKDKEDQWLEKKFLGNKDHIVLEHLQWNVGYEVQIIATNRLGHSEPTMYEFIMPPKPNIIADTLFSGLGIGAVIGLAVAALLLILVVTDVSCFFMRQCGLLMCITRRICGKKTGSSGKSKELEEGKAAYLKLLLKEENGKEALSAETIEIKISNDIIQTKESDSKA